MSLELHFLHLHHLHHPRSPAWNDQNESRCVGPENRPRICSPWNSGANFASACLAIERKDPNRRQNPCSAVEYSPLSWLSGQLCPIAVQRGCKPILQHLDHSVHVSLQGCFQRYSQPMHHHIKGHCFQWWALQHRYFPAYPVRSRPLPWDLKLTGAFSPQFLWIAKLFKTESKWKNHNPWAKCLTKHPQKLEDLLNDIAWQRHVSMNDILQTSARHFEL